MERKIGEVFELDGVKLRVEKTPTTLECFGCFFEKNEFYICRKYKCFPEERLDKTDVIFTKVKE